MKDLARKVRAAGLAAAAYQCLERMAGGDEMTFLAAHLVATGGFTEEEAVVALRSLSGREGVSVYEAVYCPECHEDQPEWCLGDVHCMNCGEDFAVGVGSSSPRVALARGQHL